MPTFKARQMNIVMSTARIEDKHWTWSKKNWVGNPTFIISCSGTYDKPVLLFSYKTGTMGSRLASSNLFIYRFIHSLHKYLLSTYDEEGVCASKQTPAVPAFRHCCRCPVRQLHQALSFMKCLLCVLDFTLLSPLYMWVDVCIPPRQCSQEPASGTSDPQCAHEVRAAVTRHVQSQKN